MSARRMLAAASVIACLPLVAGAIGCGGSSFPEAEPCVTPTATPSPQGSRTPTDNRYRMLTGDGMAELESMSAEIRARWPNDEPSNRVEFRESFAAYVRDITCLATDLKALAPRTEQLAQFDASFDTAMDETIELAEFGREAVKSRNSSTYRQWIRRVDAMPAVYGNLRASQP